MVSKSKITVFYDGKCGLCSKEINFYKKIAPKNIFNWQDITVSTDQLDQLGISLADGLKLLHVKDYDGNLKIGIDGFVCIWHELKYWRLLAMIVKLPLIKQLLNMAYKSFAHWRFKRLAHCQLASEDKMRNS